MTYRGWDEEDAAAASVKPTTSAEHRNEESTADDSSRFPIQLGVNQTTGRVQWCPDCRYVKIMIMVPIVLTPIVLILMLFSPHSGLGIGTAHTSDSDTNLLDDSIEDHASSTAFDGRRCTAIRFSMAETIDDGERDFLRDVRTSFIPPDFVYVPPNCRGNQWTEDEFDSIDSSAQDDETDQEIEHADIVDRAGKKTFGDVYGELNDNFYYRQRRETETNETVNVTEAEADVLVASERPVEEIGLVDASHLIELSARPVEGMTFKV